MIAIIFQDKRISYNELNEKSDILAAILINYGVTYNSFVCIYAENSIEVIVGIIAILKAGGIYVPIDYNYPQNRIKYILLDCNPKAILVYNTTIDSHIPVISLNNERIWNRTSQKIRNYNLPSDLIYCIYTSGTTGKPKGSLIENKSVVNLVINPNFIKLDGTSVILQTGSIAFDASTFEIWGSLLNGGTLVLSNLDIITDTSLLRKYIKKYSVNIMWLTSSLYNQIVQSDKSVFNDLGYLLIGGEKLSEKHVRILKSYNKNIRLINGYGPTENTTFTTTYEIKDEASLIYIGKPVNHSNVYIMQNNQLCGIEMKGELCITGVGLSKGYLNNDELTKEKFKINPFGSGNLYHSGDLARWTHDGNIEYLGRIDEQIKIRGYRIELGEIECIINRFNFVNECVVICKYESCSSRNKVLCAYIVSDEIINIDLLQQALRKELPAYMIPTYILQIDYIPLTSNGKIDKGNLPNIMKVPNKEYISPSNEIEIAICSVVSEILDVKHIGLMDNFIDLGGDSIKGMRISFALEKLHMNISVKELLTSNNFRELAKKIVYRNVKETELFCCKLRSSTIEQLSCKIDRNHEKIYKQSTYMLDTFKTQECFTISTLYSALSKDELQVIQAVGKILYEQEVFRTGYSKDENHFIIFQYDYQWEIPIIDIIDDTSEGNIKNKLDQIYSKQRTFRSDELLANIIIIRSHSTYSLYINVHHMIWDGFSNLLMKELLALYIESKNPMCIAPIPYHMLLENRTLSAKQISNKNLSLSKIIDSSSRQIYKQTRNESYLMLSITVILTNDQLTKFINYTTRILLSLLTKVIFRSDNLSSEIFFFDIVNGRSKTDNYNTLGLFSILELNTYNQKTREITYLGNELQLQNLDITISDIIRKYGDKMIFINNVSTLTQDDNSLGEEEIIELPIDTTITLTVVSTIDNNQVNIYLPCLKDEKSKVKSYLMDILDNKIYT